MGQTGICNGKLPSALQNIFDMVDELRYSMFKKRISKSLFF